MNDQLGKMDVDLPLLVFQFEFVLLHVARKNLFYEEMRIKWRCAKIPNK